MPIILSRDLWPEDVLLPEPADDVLNERDGLQDSVVVFVELDLNVLHVVDKSPVFLKLSATLLEPLPIATSNLVF